MEEVITTIKGLSYGILIPIFTYTGISSELVTILTILITFDIVTALIREVIVGEKIKSSTLWVGLSSKLLLICMPFIFVLIGKGIGMNLGKMAELILSTFIVAEGYSILGNIVQIRLKDKTIDEQDSITLLIKKLQSFIVDILNKLIDIKK